MLQITKLGASEIKWIAVDIKGNQSAVQTKRVLVGADEETGTVGGSVPATLALTLGAPATFGAFTPGVAKEYTATTEATVISTAGDATLSVADPSPTNTGTWSTARSRCRSRCRVSASSRRGPHRPPTRRCR